MIIMWIYKSINSICFNQAFKNMLNEYSVHIWLLVTPVSQQKSSISLHTPADLPFPALSSLSIEASCVQRPEREMGWNSLHCVHIADFARTRAGSISDTNTVAQCITLITLASHFSCMKPSAGLTATGSTLGQSLAHHHHYQQRAGKVLT